MAIFTKTEKELSAFNGFINNINGIINNLEPTAKEEDINALKKLINNFQLKTDDFFNKNRKLNIGVVGQVKAGKSSFLNTLLFNGQEVLPKASTPKTATLTKMEYSEENIIQIEYYSMDEWEVLEENASVDLDDEIYSSAREIVGMVKRSGIDAAEYLEKEVEEIKFDTYEELIGHLNDYVGEDGKFTPLVKAVTLFLNKEEFKEISIVDTPGLNDPIASRTIRTKEFMEVCDVVFFLSQSGSFLDKSDWTLLSSQLPQKGVKKLVLVASKYDSGIRDILRHKDEDDDIFGEDDNTTDNIPKACKIIGRKLRKRASEKVQEFIKDLKRRECSEELIQVIEECKEPILVSAMCHNMTNKTASEYNSEELNVYNALIKFSDDIESDLRVIGNISEVQKIFDSVVLEKEDILSTKAAGFIPTAEEELKQFLSESKEKAEKRFALLAGNDIEQIRQQKRQMENQINGIRADIAAVFGEMSSKLEREKANAVKDLRNASKEYGTISERTGTVTKTGSYEVSTSKWYNPFSWGSSRTEYYTYEEHYSYMNASDAVDNLRKYSVDAVNEIESVFSDAIEVKEMKRKLLNVIINNFDMGSEKYDSSLFRILIEKTVNNIEFPIVKIDISSAMKGITAKFSGEITSPTDKASLSEALANAVSRIYSEMSDKMTSTVKSFKEEMTRIQEELQTSMLENINEEFNDILAKYEDKENEIDKIGDYISKLKAELKKL